MRPLRIVFLCAWTAVLAEPASASEGWYVGLGLAPAWLHTEFRYADGSRISPPLDTSFMVDGAIGYKWRPNWRVELEPFWTVVNVKKSQIGNRPHTQVLSNVNADIITGDIRTRGFLANVALDTPINRKFALTVGGGLGWANVSPSVSALGGLAIADQGESGFAWQLLAGITYSIDDNFELQLDYRYRGITDTHHNSSFVAINPVTANNTDLQSIVLSIRWYPWKR